MLVMSVRRYDHQISAHPMHSSMIHIDFHPNPLRHVVAVFSGQIPLFHLFIPYDTPLDIGFKEVPDPNPD